MRLQAAGVQGRVTGVMRGALARAADPKEPMAPGDLLRLAATVRVLEALAPVGIETSKISFQRPPYLPARSAPCCCPVPLNACMSCKELRCMSLALELMPSHRLTAVLCSQ